jgi:putative endonuclease
MRTKGRAQGRHAEARPPRRSLGAAGEDVAAQFLVRQGFEIVARNCRSRLGEIDLVARDGATLVFVEVKTRRGTPAEPPQAGVDGRKQRRLARLALDYLAREWRRDLSCRFDVVGVTFDAEDPHGRPPRVEHLRGAFGAEGWAG